MLLGIAFALAAGLMWGLVFVGPLLLPEYPPALHVFGRYLAFGLIAIPMAWFDREQLARLHRADWLEALKLTIVGNFLYYQFLASAIQHAGGPLPTMIIGTLPVVIAIFANQLNRERDGQLPWRQLTPCLGIILAGIACVNQVEMASFIRAPQADLSRYLVGVLQAILAMACWTWYPIRNANWLRDHPGRKPRAWATAQGLVTLPLALGGYAIFWGWMRASGDPLQMPFGPRPEVYIGFMLAVGLLASWLGTQCWNEASQRLPTALVGQLIVFETLAALAYAYLLRGRWPEPLTLIGILLLLLGVFLAVRIKPQKPSEASSA